MHREISSCVDLKPKNKIEVHIVCKLNEKFNLEENAQQNFFYLRYRQWLIMVT